jgi:pyridoxal phosphate enzyme (YggS family)
MTSLQTRIETIRQQIATAARKVNRDPESVQLVAVSKRHPAEAIRAAYECGVRDFGENYVQELVAKAEALRDLEDLRWHLIGHLQTNKAKYVVKVAHYVHTLDNPRVIDELSRRAEQAGRQLDVSIEVNIGKEAQKSGCSPEEAEALVAHVQQAANLRLVGLMTVGQYVSDPEAARPTFVALRQLRDRIAPGSGLSMGMSGDFAVAIEEGATCVRVGTAIFGERS